MKKLMLLTVLTAFVVSCADDNPPVREEGVKLVTPQFYASISSSSKQGPLTGILTIFPCQPNSAIYYGNYVNDKLTSFDAYYKVKDGTFFNGAVNRVLSLPIGTYNMIYWGTPQYTDPIYARPAVREPARVIGSNMADQKYSLVKMPADTTYFPAYDLVYAVSPANIGSEDLSASLKRVVAGLKIIIKNKDNTVLNPSIDSLYVHITGISTGLNFYTGEPESSAGSIAFPLVRSTDSTQMSNATVMLFPSIGKPVLRLFILLKNGTKKSFHQTLNAPLTANQKLILNLTLGDILSEETSGDFTIENWEEVNQEIDVPILD